ncbi:HMCN [Mytilus coruscus]|uniref:HMCN n=1 Tax=Mytilus coruscus TaxID=42192 RepID=A0A6J8E2S6_MYTCO|nr:HMCN [Mytilus coruscus]
MTSADLDVENGASSYEGFYICTATNSVGSGQSPQICLDVIGSIPTVTVPLSRYTVNIGSSVTLQSINKYDGSTTQSPSLIINNADESDQANYVCRVTNSIGTGISSHIFLDVLGSVPSVSLTRTSFTGNYRDTIILGCTVSANPPATSVYWQKVTGSTTTTVDMSNSKYTGPSVGTPSLTITNLNSNDAGNYICLAANSVGTGQSIQGPLTVIGNPPVVTVRQSTYSTSYGNTIMLACVVSANPAHTAVYWTRQSNNGNTVTLNPASSTKYSGSSTRSPSLIINNVDFSDEGNYICHANNAVGTGQSSQKFLDVIGNIPIVTASISDASVQVGNPVIIRCIVISTPAATQTVWKRNINNADTTIDISSSRYSVVTTSNPSLTINSVQADDQGQYFCQASNSEGTGTSNYITLTVTGDAPTSISISPSPITVNESQTITATCTAQGSPTITYTWFKGNSNTQLSTGSVLRITSSTRIDAGTYQCRALNTYGNADATVAVEVRHVPDVNITQPTQGAVGQTIIIQCSYISKPAATNVTWSTGNQGITVDGNKYIGASLSNPSLTITNLAASDQASYRCSVMNLLGQGDSSSVTLSVDTSTAPSFIRIVPAEMIVEAGQSFTLTCEADGNPVPTFIWYKNDVIMSTGADLVIPDAIDTKHRGIILCRANNTKGSIQTWEYIDVQFRPVSTVTPTSISGDNPVNLSCDTRANPLATEWQWFNNSYPRALPVTSMVLNVNMDANTAARVYTCIAINTIGPSDIIPFDVAIVTTVISSTETPTVCPRVFTTGEIVAIVLGIVFVQLLTIGISVCCCCQDKCASLCGGKKERISPQPPPKRVQIPVYYEEPDESVISLRKLEIPTFKKDIEKPKKRNIYSEKRKLASDNTYSDITPTYEEEKVHRKRWRREKKKNKRRHDQTDA